MEHDLVEGAQHGDTEAFQALVHECADRLYAIAHRILREPDRAEDALQQALIRIWEDLPHLRDPTKFDAWTYRLVVHASYREAKRERRWRVTRPRDHGGPARGRSHAQVLDRDET